MLLEDEENTQKEITSALLSKRENASGYNDRE
jgi:hypothetical protein